MTGQRRPGPGFVAYFIFYLICVALIVGFVLALCGLLLGTPP